MEKFIVLKKIGDFSPTVERTFSNRDDAFLFKSLLEKSETYKRSVFFRSTIGGKTAMTQADVRFLQRLHEAHKREIQRDCKARKLDKGIYYARVHAAEKTAQDVLQSMMCRG